MTRNEWPSSTDPAAMLHCLEVQSVRGHADGLIPRPSDRKLRLFACACRRQHPWLNPHWGPENSWAKMEVDGRGEPGEEEAIRSARRFITDPNDVPNLRPVHAAILRDVVGDPFAPVTLPPGPPCGACKGSGVQTVEAPTDSRAWDRGDVCMEIGCPACGGDGKEDGHDGTGRQPCPWLTPQVVSLATAAYEERVCVVCGHTESAHRGHAHGAFSPEPSHCSQGCGCLAFASNGALDPARLAVLSDALEEAGCPAYTSHDDETPQRLLARLLDVGKTDSLGGMCVHDAGPNRTLDDVRLSAIAEKIQRAWEVERRMPASRGKGGLRLTHWHTGNGHASSSFQLQDTGVSPGGPVAWQSHLTNAVAVAIIREVGGRDAHAPHPLLAHLRSPGPHFRGCWAVDLALGKS